MGISQVQKLDITYGNMSGDRADRMCRAADVFLERQAPGCTEPWIVELLCGLLKSTGFSMPRVIETGGFLGTTSAWLLRTIRRMGGGHLMVAEIDPDRAAAIERRLERLTITEASFRVYAQDVMAVIHGTVDNTLAMAFVDDDHGKAHVHEEIVALQPKMQPGGLILLHDVWGVTDLQSVVRAFGGFSLNCPRAGPAGGLGIIQQGSGHDGPHRTGLAGSVAHERTLETPGGISGSATWADRRRHGDFTGRPTDSAGTTGNTTGNYWGG